MKKLLSIAVCAAAVAAYGTDPDPVTLGTVGVTAVTCSTTNAIIAVSYGDLAMGGNAMTVSNLVKTANLKANDRLYVYNESGGTFTVFTLEGADGSAKFWRETETFTLNESSTEKADPAATTRAPGYGIWLIRGTGWASANYPEFTFYLYGSPDVTLPTTVGTAISIPAGSVKLLGNPKSVAAAPTVTNIGTYDRIIVPASSLTGTKIYTWNANDKTWYSGLGTRKVELSVPAGAGFWYSATDTGSARQLYWK